MGAVLCFPQAPAAQAAHQCQGAATHQQPLNGWKNCSLQTEGNINRRLLGPPCAAIIVPFVSSLNTWRLPSLIGAPPTYNPPVQSFIHVPTTRPGWPVIVIWRKTGLAMAM